MSDGSTVAERLDALAQWNDSSLPATTTTVVALFAAQVRRTPDALAVVAPGIRMTYAELGAYAFQLARRQAE